MSAKVKFGPLGEPLLLIGEHQKNKENRDLGHQKPQKFLACRRSQCLRRPKRVFLISHDFAHTYSDFETAAACFPLLSPPALSLLSSQLLPAARMLLATRTRVHC